MGTNDSAAPAALHGRVRAGGRGRQLLRRRAPAGQQQETVTVRGRYVSNHSEARLLVALAGLASPACRISPLPRRWPTASCAKCCRSGATPAPTGARLAAVATESSPAAKDTGADRLSERGADPHLSGIRAGEPMPVDGSSLNASGGSVRRFWRWRTSLPAPRPRISAPSSLPLPRPCARGPGGARRCRAP